MESMSHLKMEERPVACERCGHEFLSYIYRVVNGDEEILVDRDNDVVYDLVKVCRFCRTVFHWHTKDRTIQKHTEAYQTLFPMLFAPALEAENESKAD